MLAVVSDGVAAKVLEVPDLTPGTDELLIKVEAAALNGVDRLGRRVRPGENVQKGARGFEMSGTVVAKGSGTSRFSVGDRIMGITLGGQAEFAVIKERIAMPVPDGLSMIEAGGFAEVFCTADDAVFTQCLLAPGDTFLATGAAGGVGSAALQLARATGAKAIGSVRNEAHRVELEKRGFAVAGPNEVYDLGPFDVVLELVGGDNIRRDMESLAVNGRIVLIGTEAGSLVEVDFRELSSKRARIQASGMHSRPFEERALVTRRVEHRVLPLLASGAVQVWVDSTYAFQDAPAAYEYFSDGGKLGKVILTFP